MGKLYPSIGFVTLFISNGFLNLYGYNIYHSDFKYEAVWNVDKLKNHSVAMN